MHHPVVGLHECRKLVIPPVYDIFEPVDPCRVHLLAHLDDRLEHRIDNRCAYYDCRNEKYQENVDDCGRMEECIPLEVISSLVRIRGIQYCDHLPLAVEQRGIQGIEPVPGKLFPGDEEALLLIYYIVVGILVYSGTEDHPVEYLRGRGLEYPSSRGVQVYVGLCHVPHLIDYVREFL